MASDAAKHTRTIDLERIKGLPAEDVSRRAKLCLRFGDVARRTAAFYIADVHDRELWRQLKYASWRHYVKTSLKMPLSTADQYARIGRELEELPEVDAEFAAGRINLTCVKHLVKVVVPETAPAWVAFTKEVRADP